MNKTSKIAILGSALAIVGTLGYTAFAANNEETNGRQSMLESAVENGIIDEDTKTNLEEFNQQEMQNKMNEQVQEKLSSAVEDGTITQEESDEIQAWYDSKPESLEKIGGLGFGGKGRFGDRGAGMDRPNGTNGNSDSEDTSTETE